MSQATRDVVRAVETIGSHHDQRSARLQYPVRLVEVELEIIGVQVLDEVTAVDEIGALAVERHAQPDRIDALECLRGRRVIPSDVDHHDVVHQGGQESGQGAVSTAELDDSGLDGDQRSQHFQLKSRGVLVRPLDEAALFEPRAELAVDRIVESWSFRGAGCEQSTTERGFDLELLTLHL